MKNPFKPDRAPRDRDNPAVPNIIEKPAERAADRAAMGDNPLVPDAIEEPAERGAARAQMRDNPVVPNVIERPVERAIADDRSDVVDRPGAVFDRPGINDGPGDRPGVMDSPADIARGNAAGSRAGSVVDRPGINDGPGDRPGVMDSPRDIARGTTAGPTLTDDTRHIDLFPNDELLGYRTQWESIQTGFVDEPRQAVQQADALVSQVVTRLTDVFTRERATLEGQWTKGDNASTEDLRLALKRYRSFFHRLLSM